MPLDAIIILAYGPRRSTTDAVERAKALANPSCEVVVVPAVRAAGRHLGTLRSPAVRVVGEPGRAGLATVLEREDDQTVLLVHDDVLVTEATVDALLAEHRRGGAIALPWSNDTDMPNFVGALPPARRAGAAVARAATEAPRTECTEIRPSCLLTSAGRLRGLLPHRLTVARTMLRSSSDAFVVAPGAVVAHDSTCVSQVAAPGSPDSAPLVTAALIVRDEAANLPDCLTSLDGFVDRIVVCDTGSVDDTIEIARSHGAEILEVPWRDDFAWARNQVLDQCRDSWFVLQIDADERLVGDALEFRRLLATDVDDTVGFTVAIDNYGDTGRIHTSHRATRLFRPADVSYVGALHELPLLHGFRDLETARLEGVHLEHHGYRSAAFLGRGKATRNLDIARADHEAAPTAGTALHYARSLVAADGDTEEIRVLLEQAIEKGLTEPPRAYALGLLAHILRSEGRLQEALDTAAQALDLVPADDGAAVAHAEIALDMNKPELAVERARARRAAPSPTPYNASTISRSKEMVAVARAHAALNDLDTAVEAAEEAIATGFFLDEDGWVDLVSMLVLVDPDRALERLLDGAASDATGNCLAAVSRVCGTAAAGPFATRLVAEGHVGEDAVKVGLAWALVTQDDAALGVLGPHVGLLPTAVVEKLVDAATARGWEAGAAVVARGLLQGV